MSCHGKTWNSSLLQKGSHVSLSSIFLHSCISWVWSMPRVPCTDMVVLYQNAPPNYSFKVINPLHDRRLCWGDCMPCLSGKLRDGYDLFCQNSVERVIYSSRTTSVVFNSLFIKCFCCYFFFDFTPAHTRTILLSAQNVKVFKKFDKYFTRSLVMAACLLLTLLM